MDKYISEEHALARLQRNGVIKEVMDRYIVLNNHKPIGLVLWGVIDYLKKVHHYKAVKE